MAVFYYLAIWDLDLF